MARLGDRPVLAHTTCEGVSSLVAVVRAEIRTASTGAEPMKNPVSDVHGTSGRSGTLSHPGAAGDAAAAEWLAATVARFDERLQRDGLHTALGYLNSRTRFRYTGAYRFAPPLLSSIEIFDRENPSLALCAEVAMDTTYCSIVATHEEALAVENAANDYRVHDHKARERFAAYCGVPLRDRDGKPFGTLCHYDPRPRIGSCEHIELLERVAPLVADYSLARLA